MTVLIRTFPPSNNPNYGGILQAWALQQALLRLGYDSVVDSSLQKTSSKSTRKLKLLVKKLLTEFGSMRYFSEEEIGGRDLHRYLFDFPNRMIRQLELYDSTGVPKASELEKISAFIVGSDQIWRPDYVNVTSFLLDFLAHEDARPRIAYAASFGRENADAFSKELIDKTRPLAKLLTAVSVREESGVRLANDLWGVEATQMVDPTLLLEQHDYRSIFSQTSHSQIDGKQLTSYILDSDESSTSLVESISLALDAPITDLYRPLPSSRKRYWHDPERYRRISVENWLRDIAHADFVVTDSFHGTVFSILFNRPFLVKVNHSRGATRFASLLSLFGLKDRIARGDNSDIDRAVAPIDWTGVNQTLKVERERGLGFLEASLSLIDSGN